MEYWNIGIMEYWNIGLMVDGTMTKIIENVKEIKENPGSRDEY